MSEHETPLAVSERVHYISNNYDGPLEGLADFHGVPHAFFLHDEVFRRVPGDNPEDPDDFEVDRIYSLHPVSEQAVAGLIEKHEIFECWHQAYSQDRNAMEHHPALLGDRPRYDALKAEWEPYVEGLRALPPAHLALGDFHANQRQVPAGYSRWGTYTVNWTS